ncbi:ParA family protein [Natrinema soli]|uniref:ParA family protein n=1 Tax=Natrinema soli TaxID=1930624 RepID=A0ABD5SHW9_9EURY|nr:ParA family protein [Natrinema soli]
MAEETNSQPTHTVATFVDKGGVGKTTTTAHLGVALAQSGYDVLLIDLAGKQGDLSKQFGITPDPDAWPDISTVFRDKWKEITEKLPDAVDELVTPTGEGPDLIPATQALDGLDAELNSVDNARERYSRFDQFLTNSIDGRYEFVLIDLPGVTNNVTLNGLWAAENVMVPVRPGPFEAEQAAALQDDIAEINDQFDLAIELTLVIPNEVDLRTKLGQHYVDAFAEEYQHAIGEHIPSSQDIQNQQKRGETVFALEEPSKTARRALEAYEANAELLEARVGKSTANTPSIQ